MELNEPEDGVGGSHRNVENKMYILAIVYIRSLNLEKVGGMKQHQLILMSLCLLSCCVEDMSQLCAIEKINGKAA